MSNEPSIKRELVPARPERLPAPTYWPFFLALGIAFAGWGLLSSWIIAAGGLILVIIALIKWIKLTRNE